MPTTQDTWELTTGKLIHAAQEGDVETLIQLIHDGVNVNYESFWSEIKYNPLYQAIKHNQFESAKILIKHGADVNFESFCHLTPLYAAAKANNDDMVAFLLEHGAINHASHPLADLFCESPSPFIAAAINGNVDIAKLLLEHGSDINELSGIMGGASALTYAASYSQVEMMAFLIEQGININTLSLSDEHSPIIDAIASSALFNALIAGIHITGENKALHVLLDAGANDLGWSELHQAIATKDYSTAEKLLATSSENIDMQDTIGLSPMHYALLSDDTSFLVLLDSYGADTNLIDSSMSLLNTAFYLYDPNKPSLFEWVVNHTDDIDHKDAENGNTLLMYVCHSDSIYLVETLLSAGANINAQDDDGMTPLHHAINGGQDDIVKLLVAHGANLYLKDSEGKTPFDYASPSDVSAEVKLILQPKESLSLNIKDVLNGDDISQNLLLNDSTESSHQNSLHNSHPISLMIPQLSLTSEHLVTSMEHFA